MYQNIQLVTCVPPANATHDEVVELATREVITQLNALPTKPSLKDAAGITLRSTNLAFREQATAAGLEKPPPPIRQIFPRQAAELLMCHREVALIPAVESETERATALLAVWDETEGIYTECSGASNQLTVLLREMVFTANDRWIAEAISAVRDLAPVRHQTDDGALVALDDCVYNCHTDEREDYDPQKHVFLSKVRTRLPETEPELPRIQNPDGSWWDPRSWLEQTMGSEEMADAMLEVQSYNLRPRAFGDDKVVVLLSESGSNGKGTQLALMRGILGGSKGLGCSSLGLEHFAGRADGFMLTRLIGAVANLSDESDADQFMASSAMLKAISAHDPVQINRKNRDPIEVRLFVPLIFSLNKLPRVKDKSGAVDRRLHIIRFPQRFMGEGTEIKRNPLIKSDYIARKEVREWFVWQALKVVGPITELSVPSEVAGALEEYRGANDPVVEFWRMCRPLLEEAGITMAPLEMLYDAFAAWTRQRRGSGAAVESDRLFRDRLAEEAVRDGWRDERGGRGDRRMLSLKSWPGVWAESTREVFGHLGASQVIGGDGRPAREIVTGDRRLARWTRGVLPANTEMATQPLPARGPCLTRDVAATPAGEPTSTPAAPAPASPPWASPSTGGAHLDPFAGGSTVTPLSEEPEA